MSASSLKYFLYARKSTKDGDRQVLSIPSQLEVLRRLAQQQNLSVIAEFTERESAHVPGRPEFTTMMRRIEAGEANGILAWHPDRLARNSLDGGAIIYFLDSGKLIDLRFASFWFENTPQGKSNLGHEFVQTKQYSDKLACDTKRGLVAKARMGIYPSTAPCGYLNDKTTKTIVLDPHVAPIIRAAFEAFATGDMTLNDMQDFLAERGVLSQKRFKRPDVRGGMKVHHDCIRRMLRNPFYYGHFEYSGEFYEGKHKPIISKALFDKVQTVLQRRTHCMPKERQAKAFTGLFQCAECGMSITAEVQKGHTYYRCTKKSKSQRCSQRFIRAEELEHQLSALLQEYTLRPDWAEQLLEMAEQEQNDRVRSSRTHTHEKQTEIAALNAKLERLVSIYVNQDIDRDAFLAQKAELLTRKKLLQEMIEHTERKFSRTRLEPFKEWVKTAKTLGEIALNGSSEQKKRVAVQVFGSNLFLDSKKARGCAVKPWSFLRETSQDGGVVPRQGLEPWTN